jgi:hypothetical protein
MNGHTYTTPARARKAHSGTGSTGTSTRWLNWRSYKSNQ